MKTKWFWIALAVLIAFGYISFQLPGVQCPGSMVHCPGVGCVSGPDKCVAGAKGGPSAIFSTTWEKFTNGKDLFPDVPVLNVGPDAITKACWDGTRAKDGRCSEYWGP